MIVADVLVDLLDHLDRRISLFSGIDFNVDVENGLTGVCDFLVSIAQCDKLLGILSSMVAQKA